MLTIRTQDRFGLIPYNNPITTISFDDGKCKIMLGQVNSDGLLGTYATKERALEVLDEIERAVYGKLIIPTTITPNENHWIYTNGIISSVVNENKEIQVLPYVYQMPSE